MEYVLGNRWLTLKEKVHGRRTVSDYSIKELRLSDMQLDLLDDFNRYQEVKKCWRKQEGAWILKETSFVEQWDTKRKQEIVTNDLTDCIKSDGTVWGVFDNDDHLIGFASLSAELFGKRRDYLRLNHLHISYEYRNQGIGKELFQKCKEKAAKAGASQLYISSHSSEESCAFYFKIGCVDADEVDVWSIEHEPFDRQIKYVLNSCAGFDSPGIQDNKEY